MVDGKYTENNKAIVQLVDKDGKVVNPKTNTTNAIILVTLLIVSLVIVLSLKKKNKFKYSTLALIIGIVSIPTFVSAVESLKLTMNVNVEIEKGYSVDYLITYPLLLKDSEMDSYDLRDTECETIYIDSVSNENKYNYCNGGIMKSGRLYAPGEQVQLPILSIKGIIINSEPTQIDDNTYLVSDGIINENIYSIDRWEYIEKACNYFGYPILDSDKTTMNFGEYVFDDWDSNGYFTVDALQRFTMPSHNVLFTSYTEKVEIVNQPQMGLNLFKGLNNN